MNLDPVAVRWTDALFNLAKKDGAQAEVQRDLERLRTELSSPAVREFILGGRGSRQERRSKLDALASGFHPLTRNFLNLLFDRNREMVLGDAAGAFHQRLLKERGEAEGVVESARPLAAAELEQVAAAVGQMLNKTVRLEGRMNPELVGGVRVFVGAHMIDQTIQGRLDELRRKMQEVRLPQPN